MSCRKGRGRTAALVLGALLAAGGSGHGGVAKAQVVAPDNGPPVARDGRLESVPDGALSEPPSAALSVGPAVAGPPLPEVLPPAPPLELTSEEVMAQTDAAGSQRLRLSVGDRVFFASGSSELGLRARSLLLRQASWLKSWAARAVIVGHADEGGTEVNDDQVSRARALAVRDRLIEQGVAPDRLLITPMGRRERISACDGAQCAAQNRRALIVILSTSSNGNN